MNRTFTLALLAAISFAVSVRADNYFEGRNGCFRDLKNFAWSDAQYSDYVEKRPIRSAGDYFDALLKAPGVGNVVAFPSKQRGEYGYYVVLNKNIYWQKCTPSADSNNPNMELLEMKFPESGSKSFYAFVSCGGTSTSMATNFTLSERPSHYQYLDPKTNKYVKVDKYVPSNPPARLNPESERDYNDLFIRTVRSMRHTFVGMVGSPTKDGIYFRDELPKDYDRKAAYKAALDTCLKRLRPEFDKPLIEAIKEEKLVISQLIRQPRGTHDQPRREDGSQ